MYVYIYIYIRVYKRSVISLEKNVTFFAKDKPIEIKFFSVQCLSLIYDTSFLITLRN